MCWGIKEYHIISINKNIKIKNHSMSDCSSYSRSDSYGRDYDEEIPSTSIQDILDTFADLD